MSRRDYVSLDYNMLTCVSLFLDEDEDGQGGLEPISSENILSSGRRTRGKNIDFQKEAEKSNDMDDDDEDEDEDFAPNDNRNNDNDDDDQMRD